MIVALQDVATKDVGLGATEIRLFLHLLSVSVWLGGQIVMLGLVPLLRSVGHGAPAAAAKGFGRVAWPAFFIAVVTGIWNIMAVDMGAASSSYNATLGIKLLLVVVTGVAAAIHQSTDKASVRGATGGIGFLAALIAFLLGVILTN